MSRAASPGTGLVYGLERVCAVWGVPRSSFYAEQRKGGRPPRSRRRGVVVRSRKSPTRTCWRPSWPTLETLPSRAKGSARSGPGCGCNRAYGSRGRGSGF